MGRHLFGEGKGVMTRGERSVVAIIFLRLAPYREDGGAGKEVGACPRHAGFLFVASPADLGLTKNDNSTRETLQVSKVASFCGRWSLRGIFCRLEQQVTFA